LRIFCSVHTGVTQMENSERTACIQCDIPLAVGDIAPMERACCPRCGHVLTVGTADRFDRALALGAAAALFLVLANSFPFLSMQAKGLESTMTLPRTAVMLHQDGYTVLAALVLGAIAIVPTFVLCSIFALAVPLRRARRRPWLVAAGRSLFALSPWAMAEVFIIGVIVSLVKIGHMAHVILGASFWSYVGFAICFTAALSSLDRLSVWREIERCSA
jgi:paraquat-inducible protein A